MPNPLDIDRNGRLTPTDGAFAQMYHDDYQRAQRPHGRAGCRDGCSGCAILAGILIAATMVLMFFAYASGIAARS